MLIRRSNPSTLTFTKKIVTLKSLFVHPSQEFFILFWFSSVVSRVSHELKWFFGTICFFFSLSPPSRLPKRCINTICFQKFVPSRSATLIGFQLVTGVKLMNCGIPEKKFMYFCINSIFRIKSVVYKKIVIFWSEIVHYVS